MNALAAGLAYIEAIVLASTPSFSRHSGAQEVNVSLPPLSNSAGNYSPHGALCTPEWENPSWVEFSEDKVFVIRLDDFLLSWSVPWGGEMRACGIPFAPSGLFWGGRERERAFLSRGAQFNDKDFSPARMQFSSGFFFRFAKCFIL